ncbi:MAG: right-handed parallel beta-helix repeat-containing protein [Gammaproteobacteria bacterium]|nr:right-handed parallel beta-helix repeat-containing protein [Gammaproteobacteria bacterium]
MKAILRGLLPLLLVAVAAPLSAAEIAVKDGESIQAAVKRAKPGDVVLIHPGQYRESVYVDKDDITLRGVVVEGKWPTLDGEGKRNDAILYSGNGIVVEWLKIVRYKGNGIMGQAGNNFAIRYNVIDDAGVYGIFPQFGQNGVIEYNVLSRISDAAIYVGMCDHIDVRNNEVFGSVAGIEIENSRHNLVENNYAHDNTAGILAFITPGLPIKTAYDIVIRNNFIVNNNTPNFGAPGSIVSKLPVGIGVVVMAADDVVIEGNIVSGNNTAGVVVTDLSFITDIASDPESEPNPDRTKVLDNLMFDNGADPVAEVKAAMLSQFSKRGPDILAAPGSAQAPDKCIAGRDRYTTFGVKKWADCGAAGTANVRSHRLAEKVAPRTIANDEGRIEHLYKGICAGCHAYNMRMIGPPTIALQAQYEGNPQGIADYLANPMKKRVDFPPMPPQDHLSPEVRLKVAEYLLNKVKK